jgi:[ribosomal protein S5]-alanine N-acetyltransferase
MFPILTTERFLLQEITTDDQVFIFEGLSHPQIIPYYGVSYQTFDAVKAQMNFYRDMQVNETGIWWKIVGKETGERVGAIGFNNYNKQHNRTEIGYWLLPRYWKKGIIHEVLPVMIDFILNKKKIHRVEALVEVGNTASEKVLKRLGFIYEGCMRDCEIKNGSYISLLMYSLLSTDVLKQST